MGSLGLIYTEKTEIFNIMGNNPTVLRIKPSHWRPDLVIVVTGASTGIGRELALRYAQRGCKLVIAARNQVQLEEVAAECRRRGSPCLVVPTDVTQEEQCKQLVEAAVKEYGGIDMLVLNAGVGAHFPFTKEANMDVFRALLDINFFGCVHCTKHALPHLQRSRGQIVVISSVTGELGVPLRSAYCASKFAVTGFFEALRHEQGERITITICCPPAVKTEFRNNTLAHPPTGGHEALRKQFPHLYTNFPLQHTHASKKKPNTLAVLQQKVTGKQTRTDTHVPASPAHTESAAASASGGEDTETPQNICVGSDSLCMPSQGDVHAQTVPVGGVRERRGSTGSEDGGLHEHEGLMMPDRRMTVDKCVDVIMLAADKRARKVMFPFKNYMGVYIRPFFPDLVDPFIKQASKL
eukprot:GDKI01036173.1.p1 GENE.GDKI01036173.1~~GDKI01036173.1.p1  ORF type:complete len:409 (-),score=97.99 GDKI01036173.1:366-1592(-)